MGSEMCIRDSNRISELTGLDLGNFDDRLLLYVALQLDEER